MAVARIRTSDPEVVEFLSKHLADSGYKLEFVHPGEPVQGEAELEIDASRMDLDSAMEAARQESGLVTVLSGVLKAEPRRDVFEEAAQTLPAREYAEVSPYAQGAELEDEPSGLHKTVDLMASALTTGMNSVGEASKAATTRFGAWKAKRDSERATRREQRERELAIEAELRRKQEARRAEEEARSRTEEERVAAIHSEQMARAHTEAERRRAHELVASGIERQRRDEMRLAEEARWHADEQPQGQSQEENQQRAGEARVDSLQESETAAREIAISQPPVIVEPRCQLAQPTTQSWKQTVAPVPDYRDRQHLRRPAVSRERIFKRAGVAAAFVAAGVVSLWSLSSIRRPANPLNPNQLRNSAIVQQQVPFGPGTTVAPMMRPAAGQAVSPRKPVTRKPTPRARASKTRATKTHTAKNDLGDHGGGEVVVRHFAPQKGQQATVKTVNGVKVISEN